MSDELSGAVDANNTIAADNSENGVKGPESSVVGFFNSIKFKSWVGVCLLTIGPVLALGLFSLNVLGEIARDILIEGNIQAFQQVKYEVDQYVGHYDDLTNFLARDVRLNNPGSPEAWQSLQQLDQSYEYIERVVLADSQADLVAHSKPDPSMINDLSIPEKMLLNMSQRIMFSPEAFHVKTPVNTDSGELTMISTVSFHKLRKSLEGLTFGTNFRYFLVTQTGENILNQPDFPGELIADLMARPCGAYDVLPVAENSAVPQVAISLPILQYGLRIFVFQEAGEVYAVARAIGKKTIRFIILLCVLGLFLAAYASRKLAGPVVLIAAKANELSEGNLDAKVDYYSSDELGFLARCFNNMSHKIKKKVFELSALYRVTQLINTSATYQQALDGCLEHLIAIFQAQRGSIMLLNEDRSLLRVESFKNAAEKNDEETAAEKKDRRFELKIGEGIAGEVALTGTAILCMDCASDERFKNYDAEEGLKAPETLVSVPLTLHGNTIGVVNLADRSNSQAFSSEDLDLLLAISNQMAMSIDNARLHELSITDTLTELYIKKFFQIRLEDEIKRARRFEFPLTLVMFDVDGLESVNEQHGTRAGDMVLFELARILKDSVRATDIPARYGPEEFAVILAHTTSEQAMIFAERLRERVAAQQLSFADKKFCITISIGLCEYDSSIDRHYQIVERAESALARSKKAGRNTTRIYEKEEGRS